VRSDLDFVVISGDLADTPTSEEYQHLKCLLAPSAQQLATVVAAWNACKGQLKRRARIQPVRAVSLHHYV
jgi:3',5'-cyclic AMP phosphodiesterase CpdA